MNSKKRILVIGATGAFGQYITPLLADMGYQVDGVTLDDITSTRPDIRYIKANAEDFETLQKLTAPHYDGIVDMMKYPSNELFKLQFLLDQTDHYIFFSSYRIYDNKEIPVKETSPRLLDSCNDPFLVNSDDYCIYKARGENVLKACGKNNWTIIRPSICYSRMRYQLVTLEAPHTVGRAFADKKVVLPIQAKDVQGTMTWAGDAAQMIARLLFNEKAFGETFTIATAEHHTWGEIADYYKEICGLQAVWVDKEDFLLKIMYPSPYYRPHRWQLEYDRLFDRVMDNSKILAATGMSQENLMPLYKGLEYEIGRCPKDTPWGVSKTMDEYLKEHNL